MRVNVFVGVVDRKRIEKPGHWRRPEAHATPQLSRQRFIPKVAYGTNFMEAKHD